MTTAVNVSRRHHLKSGLMALGMSLGLAFAAAPTRVESGYPEQEDLKPGFIKLTTWRPWR